MKESELNLTSFQVTEKRVQLYYFLFFLVWPFGVMIDSFINWERPWSKNIFWLFCTFFGLTFIIAQGGLEAADSARIAELLSSYAHSELSFAELWRSFYSESSNNVDIIQPLLTFTVSRVTDNPVVLFTLYALILGYFISRNLWLVLHHIKGNFTVLLFIFFLSFFLINPIWNINGFRMAAGIQVFLYGVLSYLIEGNRKRLIWSGISVFFHFSLVFPVTVLMVYFFLKNRTTWYLVFFVLTSFIKELNLEAVKSILSFLPGVFQARVEGYTSINYFEALNLSYQSISWFIPLSAKGLSWVIYMMALFVYFFDSQLLNQKPILKNLFCYSLLLYGFANIFSLVPSGGRFIQLASALFFAFLVIYLSETSEKRVLPVLKLLSVPFLLLFCTVTFRMGAEFFSLTTVIGNPFYAILFPNDIPVIQAIRGLF